MNDTLDAPPDAGTLEAIALDVSLDDVPTCYLDECDRQAEWIGRHMCGCHWLVCAPHQEEWQRDESSRVFLIEMALGKYKCTRCGARATAQTTWVKL